MLETCSHGTAGAGLGRGKAGAPALYGATSECLRRHRWHWAV